MSKSEDKPNGSWAVGGGVLLGVGVGFFLLKFSALFFLGSILSGLGLGLILAPIIDKMNR
jgi:hypothetical protein